MRFMEQGGEYMTKKPNPEEKSPDGFILTNEELQAAINALLPFEYRHDEKSRVILDTLCVLLDLQATRAGMGKSSLTPAQLEG